MVSVLRAYALQGVPGQRLGLSGPMTGHCLEGRLGRRVAGGTFCLDRIALRYLAALRSFSSDVKIVSDIAFFLTLLLVRRAPKRLSLHGGPVDWSRRPR